VTVLVTGCSGFIGSNLCASLIRDGKSVVGMSLKGEGDGFKVCRGDVRSREDVDRVFRENKIERVVHLAAKSNIRGSGGMDSYLDVNIKGTANLLEACREHGVGGIVFASSSTVYGPGNKIPFSENDAVSPSSIYGITKRAGELLCFSYYQRHALPAVCLRFFTVYGEGGRKDMAVCKFTEQISKGQAIKRFGDGSSKRDYVHVSDVVEGIKKALEREKGFETINIGSGRATALNELIGIVEKNVGKKAEIVEADFPKDDVPVTQADLSKARDVLGWEPKVGLEEGIRMFVDWYRNQGRG